MRWYRRASRERRPHRTTGAAVAAALDELQGVATAEALRDHSHGRDGHWAATVVARLGLGTEQRLDLRQVADAAFSLR